MAQGGRYDEIGQVFGRARPATGFSTDLATLLRLSEPPGRIHRGIYAPDTDDPALERQVVSLRMQGERVVRALSGGAETPPGLGCDRILVRRGEEWVVAPVPEEPVGQGRIH